MCVVIATLLSVTKASAAAVDDDEVPEDDAVMLWITSFRSSGRWPRHLATWPGVQYAA